ncbi:MAG TPA: fused MFS/spermidine synthase [Bryobacteraceae bacterium]|nr:fused MFS/spermidine synthase [Bryobacteraceae bacterium]
MRSHRFLPFLLILFVGSGCSALIYEVVWLQLLQLVIGSSAASIAVLLGTFMGGMCLGSIFLPRIISARLHPLKVYALLELGTGIFSFAVLFGLPLVQHLYTASIGHGFPGILLRSAASAICLLPPTLMMGATLPAISRWIETTPQAASWWGFFYGGNIAGGVFGCLLAGFYLLRIHDMATASYVAAAINLVVALATLALARFVSYEVSASDAEAETAERAPNFWPVYFAIALSGLCALGAEVIWTRTLSLMLGPTVYTFSIILGVFLAGLGLGSSGGSVLAKNQSRARMMLALCQFLQVLAVAFAAFMLADFLPYWHGNVDLPVDPWHGFLNDLARCAIAILPSAILWGASFPLALASVASGKGDPGRLVGEVYGANTIGAILGSIGFALIMIPDAGTQHSEQLLIALSFIAAIILQRLSAKTIVATAAAAVVLWSVPAIPWQLIAFGRRLATTTGNWTPLYVAEGMNSSIAYTKYENVTTYFHVSGKTEASAEPQDMRLQRLLGHLPALLNGNPRSVLVVGCGAGVTAGTFVVHPEVQHITIVEIEPLIPPASARYFPKENHNVMHDPRTHIVYDDARHFILTSPDKFDIITSDPIHPWVKGIAPLYSTEYFELVKKHLNPGGFVTQWVPLYESDMATVQSEIATFFEAFPNGTVWGNLNTDGQGYDVVLVGQAEPLKINVDEFQQHLDRPEYKPVADSLKEVGYTSATNLLSTYAVSASDLKSWLRHAQINTDRNLRLQYLAGLGLNQYLAPMIYQQMLQYSTFPSGIFTGSPERLRSLETAVAAQRY